MRSSRELVWCILPGFVSRGLAACVSKSASSEMSASWLLVVDARGGDASWPRTMDEEARGAPVARKGESADGGVVVVLLPLWLTEGERRSSRLVFRSNGKRDSVRRRLWT